MFLSHTRGRKIGTPWWGYIQIAPLHSVVWRSPAGRQMVLTRTDPKRDEVAFWLRRRARNGRRLYPLDGNLI